MLSRSVSNSFTWSGLIEASVSCWVRLESAAVASMEVPVLFNASELSPRASTPYTLTFARLAAPMMLWNCWIRASETVSPPEKYTSVLRPGRPACSRIMDMSE